MSRKAAERGRAVRFYGKVLAGRRIALPASVRAPVGEVFEVILLEPGSRAFHEYAEGLAREKGFGRLSEKEIEKIVHESRGVR
jgi:hypothetical protein